MEICIPITILNCLDQFWAFHNLKPQRTWQVLRISNGTCSSPNKVFGYFLLNWSYYQRNRRSNPVPIKRGIFKRGVLLREVSAQRSLHLTEIWVMRYVIEVWWDSSLQYHYGEVYKVSTLVWSLRVQQTPLQGIRTSLRCPLHFSMLTLFRATNLWGRYMYPFEWPSKLVPRGLL